MDNGFGDIFKRQLTDGQITSFWDHDFQHRAVGFTQPAGENRTIGQRQLSLAPTGAAKVLGLGQRPVHTRRGDVEHIRRVALRYLIEQLRGPPRQPCQRIEIEALFAIGDHGDAGRADRGVDHDIVDFITGARELAVK